MGTLTGTPRLIKGALITLRLPDPTPHVIAFQYNPETLSRTLEAQTIGGGEGAPGEALRLTGAPVESIKLDVEIDATDQLDAGKAVAAANGIHPQLALLELLVYPSAATVIANTLLLAVGTIEVLPPEAPFTLLVWGPKRVLPVRVSEFSIAEEAYDSALNPIRAKVSLGLRVLSYNDLPRTHPGYHLFLAHHLGKEVLAKLGLGATLAETLGEGASLL